VNRVKLFALIATAAIAATPALAQEPVKLKYASPSPPQSLITVWGIGPWLNDVVKASGGTIQVQSFLGAVLGNFNQVVDRTLNGVDDIGWGILGPYSDQFPQTDVASLPFVSTQAKASSIALWRLHEKGLIKDDWGKFKVLGLFNFPPASFHSNKPIKGLADFKGLKIGVSVRVISELVRVAGAASVTMQPSDMYQAGQRGVVDGIAIGWPAFYPFKLQDVTKYHIDGAFGGTPSFVIMNKATYNRLPDKARQAFDALGGEKLSGRMGSTTDRMEEDGKKRVKAMPGHNFFTLSSAEEAAWKAKAEPIVEKWIKATPNGAAVLAAYREEIAKVLAAEAKK
jgi:TRAP-type transport system periplasmic protein